MYLFTISLHIVICVLLVLMVLMQPGKGADVSSAFGGGASSQLFGAAGPGNFLTRGTGVLFALFMVTSIALTFLGGESGGDAGKKAKEIEDVGTEGGGFGIGGSPTDAPPSEPPGAPGPAPTPSGDGAGTPTEAPASP